MCNPASQRNLQPAIRRSASGALDIEHYQRRARAERAEFLRALLSGIARCMMSPWRCLREQLAASGRRRQLAMLSSRELKDIGLAPADVPAVASGAFQRDHTRRQRAAGAGL